VVPHRLHDIELPLGALEILPVDAVGDPLKVPIATVSLSGILRDKLEAIAAATCALFRLEDWVISLRMSF
jgi:hypothetical protein